MELTADGQRAGHGLRPLIADLDVENIADLAARAAAIPGILTLWYGEGDVVTPAFIRDAAKAALDAGATFYEPDMRGWADLVAALSGYLSRLHGRTVGPDRSTVTPGGMQAVHLALMLVAGPGDNVVFLEPQWPNIRRAIHLAGAEPRPVALEETAAGWRLDLDRLLAACDGRTRAIMFSSPSNPCGWTASADELRAMIGHCRRSGVWVIADEVYNRLSFAADAAPSVIALAAPEDRVLSVNSFSKAWAMTGWRLGWLTHPPSLQVRLGAMTQYVNSGTAPFVQAAGAAALQDGEGLVAALRERCRAGIETAWEALGSINRLRLGPRPPGGMYAFFRIEGIDDSREACRMLIEEAGVGLAPGHLFGAPGRAHLRMCVARDTARIAEASDRIARALRRDRGRGG
ncbi:MAG: pyridoxal phosphate-dependent aminotransferase [Rhodobacteraceae bacterium]|jgi:aspartate/methionine/tyrosine aminotransferase|nr:pyridoxal phosphate-dependent aminotransferase [Paracoccaceae bacterium]